MDDFPIRRALAGGLPQTVGAFRFYFDDEHWEWSDTVQEIHGYEPGAMVQPTTEQVLQHKHRDDRQRVQDELDDARAERSAFSTRHRIVDARGRERQVIVVTDELTAEDSDKVVGFYGFYIDVTRDDVDT